MTFYSVFSGGINAIQYLASTTYKANTCIFNYMCFYWMCCASVPVLWQCWIRRKEFCFVFLLEMVLNKNPSLWNGLSTANHYGVDTGVYSVKSIDRGQPSGTTGVRYDMGLASDFKQGSRANGPYFCCFWGAIFHLTHIRKQFVPILSNVHSMLLMVYIK